MIFLSSNESLWVVNNAQSTYYLWIEHEEIGSLDRESAGQKGKSDQWNALDGLYEWAWALLFLCVCVCEIKSVCLKYAEKEKLKKKDGIGRKARERQGQQKESWKRQIGTDRCWSQTDKSVLLYCLCLH